MNHTKMHPYTIYASVSKEDPHSRGFGVTLNTKKERVYMESLLTEMNT